MSIPNLYVLMQPHELQELIRVAIAEELQKVPYYSHGSSPDTIMTLDEAAAYCKVCKRTLTDRVKEGELHNGGTGRKYLFKKSDLDAFVFKTKKK
jgi:excisionase family DNA binding protein